ncbi:hypothetical protein [Sphingomonas hengshuiensis]|nr:hypothetical protein [Sphingomonas hengshuiensis]
MKRLLPLALLLIGAAPSDHPRSYLLSVGNIPLSDTESIEAFSVKTWGVEFEAVCRIPPGWRIRAGSSATPDGEIAGIGSQGVTWFNTASPKALQSFILVTLHGAVQKEDIGVPGNGVPATFKGTVTISTDDGDVDRPLTHRNIRLTPARRCPVR